MKRILACIFALSLLTGCGNLSPRAEIDNQNGKIENLESNVGSLKLELGKLQQKNEIMDSDVKNLQQGYININKGNYGTQIFSGPGGILLIFSLGVIAIIMTYFYKMAQKNKKLASMLTAQIKEYNDEDLTEGVFRAALFTGLERDVVNLFKE